MRGEYGGLVNGRRRLPFERPPPHCRHQGSINHPAALARIRCTAARDRQGWQNLPL